MKRTLGMVLAALIGVACAEPAPPIHGKPAAPVAIELTQRPLGGNLYEITLTARPTADVESLDLAIDGRTTQVGPTPRGSSRTVTARVQLNGSGRSVVGSASTSVRGHRRNAAELVTIGEERVPARLPSRIVVLPDGTRVEEVRP